MGNVVDLTRTLRNGLTLIGAVRDSSRRRCFCTTVRRGKELTGINALGILLSPALSLRVMHIAKHHCNARCHRMGGSSRHPLFLSLHPANDDPENPRRGPRAPRRSRTSRPASFTDDSAASKNKSTMLSSSRGEGPTPVVADVSEEKKHVRSDKSAHRAADTITLLECPDMQRSRAEF